MKRFSICLAALVFFVTAGGCHADWWLEDVKDAPELIPPFRKELYAGELVRVKILKDKALRLIMAEGSTKGLAAIIPISDNKRVGAKRMLEKGPLVFLEMPMESDYLALRVFTGKIQLEGDVVPMKEHRVTEGNKVEVPIEPFQMVVGRFVNGSEYRSVVTYDFLSGPDVISKSSQRNRTHTLEFKNSSIEKTWKSAADKISVEAFRGDIVFKVGSPFPESK
jgi:hypothetical protein